MSRSPVVDPFSDPFMVPFHRLGNPSCFLLSDQILDALLLKEHHFLALTTVKMPISVEEVRVRAGISPLCLR